MSGTIETPGSLAGLESRLVEEKPATTGPLSLPPADPVARLRGMMRERHDESVKILSGWIEKQENAG